MGIDKARHHSTCLFILPDRKKWGKLMFQKLYQQTIEPIGLVWVWFDPTGVKIFTQPLKNIR